MKIKNNKISKQSRKHTTKNKTLTNLVALQLLLCKGGENDKRHKLPTNNSRADNQGLGARSSILIVWANAPQRKKTTTIDFKGKERSEIWHQDWI